MEEISIRSEGKILSRIFFGELITDVVERLAPYHKIFIVYDNSVKIFTDKLIEQIKLQYREQREEALAKNEEGLSPWVVSLKGLALNEEEKNISTVLDICRWLLENNADRNALLLGIGGGITTDITGFAGSIYKRGIRFAFIPTTLLSQVDAAIGGKNGVNFLDYKNMLGVTRQPDFIFNCPEVFDTLPYKDIVSGSAEMLKTFIIEDEASYEKAVNLFSQINSSIDKHISRKNKSKELLELIRAAAMIKAGIAGRDQFEKGERKKLNLGHTFAHAIEWKANTINGKHEDNLEENPPFEGIHISHGEAVAIGIAMAAVLSENSGLAKKGLAKKIIGDLISCGLPVSSPFKETELAEAMEKDKKVENNLVNFILIKRIGEVIIQKMNVYEAVSSIEKY